MVSPIHTLSSVTQIYSKTIALMSNHLRMLLFIYYGRCCPLYEWTKGQRPRVSGRKMNSGTSIDLGAQENHLVPSI